MEKMYMMPIEIWEPRYHDYTESLNPDMESVAFLIAPKKIKNPAKKQLIMVMKGRMRGQVYEVKGRDALKCRVESNGSIPCLVVPLEICKNVTAKYRIEDISAGGVFTSVEPDNSTGGEAVIANITQRFAWKIEVAKGYQDYFKPKKKNTEYEDVPENMSKGQLKAAIRSNVERIKP